MVRGILDVVHENTSVVITNITGIGLKRGLGSEEMETTPFGVALSMLKL